MERENTSTPDARDRNVEEVGSLQAADLNATAFRRGDENGEAARAERGERAPEHGKSETPPTAQTKSRESAGVTQLIRLHKLASGIVATLVIAALVGAVVWWLDARHYETTDDAFIDGRPVAVSAQVAGALVAVPVTDNELVQPGAVLARIDDRDYRTAVDQADAQIEEAKAAIANTDAQLEQQQARIEETAKQASQAQAALTFSRQENARYQDLVTKGAGTVQQAQQAASDLRQKESAFAAAEAAQTEAEKQINIIRAQHMTGEGQLKQAQAQLEQANANLSRATITASIAGRVTKLTAATGAYAVPGQTLMMVVPLELWVTANFKETQLASMRPGQKTKIEIDAFGRSFPGHVDSIQAGSGTAFSLLPAENATGNYVKVVQRVPVKIVFSAPPEVELGPGMSVVPSVKVR
ncbi:MAG: HlyD family secretion protein [Hyphomicrobiales bacterium]|nr:HlyD family secretion protein [Hyphomicrobiales bacterium]